MARNRGALTAGGRGGRPPAKPVAPPVHTPKTATPDAPRKRVGVIQFFREVRAEARKVTWTSRSETWITSVMVFIMVVLTALFFVVVDQTLRLGMQLLLKLAA
jgi:preprotein translocase subunit SecE